MLQSNLNLKWCNKYISEERVRMGRHDSNLDPNGHKIRYIEAEHAHKLNGPNGPTKAARHFP